MIRQSSGNSAGPYTYLDNYDNKIYVNILAKKKFLAFFYV